MLKHWHTYLSFLFTVWWYFGSGLRFLRQLVLGDATRPWKLGPYRQVKVLPYIHKISHNVKKATTRHGIRVVFSAPCKLSHLCISTENWKSRSIRSTCHATTFTECIPNVVYLICFLVYIGQTGHCVNTHLKEHDTSVTLGGGANLPARCSVCACLTIFNDTQIIGKGIVKCERELIQAYHALHFHL